MSVSRRRFLGLLGLAPAVPLINKLPTPIPAPVSKTASAARGYGGSGSALVTHSGWCAPLSPTYELMNISAVNRPVLESLPPIRVVRGDIRHLAPPRSER